MDIKKEAEIKALLNIVKEEIFNLGSIEVINDQNNIPLAIKYINKSLKEISILNAAALYYFSQEINISTKHIDNMLNKLHNLFDFILNKQKNSSNTLMFSEISENFEIWKDVNREELYNITLKIFYITKFLVKYFATNQRWVMVVGDICYKLPRVLLSFLDVKKYQKDDMLFDKDLPIVTSTLNVIMNIFEWSAEECLKIYAIDNRYQYCAFRGMNILYMLHLLFLLCKKTAEKNATLDRIDSLRKRVFADQKALRGDNNTIQDITKLPLEELLKNDKRYDR